MNFKPSLEAGLRLLSSHLFANQQTLATLSELQSRCLYLTHRIVGHSSRIEIQRWISKLAYEEWQLLELHCRGNLYTPISSSLSAIEISPRELSSLSPKESTLYYLKHSQLRGSIAELSPYLRLMSTKLPINFGQSCFEIQPSLYSRVYLVQCTETFEINLETQKVSRLSSSIWPENRLADCIHPAQVRFDEIQPQYLMTSYVRLTSAGVQTLRHSLSLTPYILSRELHALQKIFRLRVLPKLSDSKLVQALYTRLSTDSSLSQLLSKQFLSTFDEELASKLIQQLTNIDSKMSVAEISQQLSKLSTKTLRSIYSSSDFVKLLDNKLRSQAEIEQQVKVYEQAMIHDEVELFKF